MFYSNMFLDLRMFNFTKYFHLLFVCCFSMLFSKASISGNIINTETKEPLIGANVILLEKIRRVETNNKTITVERNTDYGASTDIEGTFIINNIPLGEYTLKAMYIGYKDKEMTITLDEDISYTFNIKMDISIKHQYGEV